jgi:3-hydroxybutyryl-CoA dehydrogenase
MTEADEINTVAILGAGTMGANIALNLAAHGVSVRLTDPQDGQLERGRARIGENARDLHRHGLLPGTVKATLGRIAYEATVDEVLKGAGLVIEAVPEKIQLKLRIFTELERKTGPDVILASNTSTFVPSSLAVGLVAPDSARRLVVMHYWNPAHLIPLVEVVPHARTSPETLSRVTALLARCAKQTVVLRKEVAGFIGNRLAFALQREAMSLVARGVASPADIDTVTTAGFGRRAPVTGVFRTADFGGLDVYLAVCQSLFPGLCNDHLAPDTLKLLVQNGMLGTKTGEGWNKYTGGEVAGWGKRLTDHLVHLAQVDQQLKKGPAAPQHDPANA